MQTGQILSLEIDSAGLVATAAWSQAVRAALENIRPLLEELGPRLVEWQQDNIFAGVGPDGVPFKPISAGTAMHRYKQAMSPKRRTIGRTQHPYGVRPLIDTTQMVSTMKWLIDGPTVSGGATARSETGFPYPEAHQLGLGVPVRAWSGLSRENLEHVNQAAARHVARALAQ